MSILESLNEDTSEKTTGLLIQALYQLLMDVDQGPNFVTPSACRAMINMLKLYNTQNGAITHLACELIPVVGNSSPRAMRYMCQAGVSQALAVGLSSFGLENMDLTFSTMHVILICINEDDEGEAAKLANFTACDAIVAALRKFGAEDESIASYACDLISILACKSRTARGILRYAGAHSVVRNAINNNHKALAMQ